MHNFDVNFSYQERLLDRVKAILKSKAELFISFEVANDEQDKRQATDMVLMVKGGQCIAVRVRRPEHRKWTDVTIRCRSVSGAKTELDKLRAGWGDWYVYAWEDQAHQLSRWCILDLTCVRSQGLLDKPRAIRSNGDGTAFITIPLRELYIAGAMVAWAGMYPSAKTQKEAEHA
jgi:hypothetical protein